MKRFICLFLTLLLVLQFLFISAFFDNKPILYNHNNINLEYIVSSAVVSSLSLNSNSTLYEIGDLTDEIKIRLVFRQESNVGKIVYLCLCLAIIIAVIIVLTIKIRKNEKKKRDKK